MLKQPIYVEFNLDAKTSPSKLIAISHVDDKYSEVLEVAVKQNDRFVYMGGATVVARMVLHRDKDYLLSDDVTCTVNANGNILIPFDNAVVKTSQGVVKIEVNITRDTDELTLQFPLWVSVTGSILDNAEVTPDSEGTIPDLLKDAADALEDATEALEQIGSYSNLEDKPQINGVTLSGNKTPDEFGVAGWKIAAIDNCIEDGVLYSTSINNQAAYVLARNITTDITQYAFCRDGRVMWRTWQAETQWQPAGEWSAWEEIGGGSEIASGVVNQNGTISFYDAGGNLLFTTTGTSVIGSNDEVVTDVIYSDEDLSEYSSVNSISGRNQACVVIAPNEVDPYFLKSAQVKTKAGTPVKFSVFCISNVQDGSYRKRFTKVRDIAVINADDDGVARIEFNLPMRFVPDETVLVASCDTRQSLFFYGPYKDAQHTIFNNSNSSWFDLQPGESVSNPFGYSTAGYSPYFVLEYVLVSNTTEIKKSAAEILQEQEYFPYDNFVSDTSMNAVQNKVIYPFIISKDEKVVNDEETTYLSAGKYNVDSTAYCFAISCEAPTYGTYSVSSIEVRAANDAVITFGLWEMRFTQGKRGYWNLKQVLGTVTAANTRAKITFQTPIIVDSSNQVIIATCPEKKIAYRSVASSPNPWKYNRIASAVFWRNDNSFSNAQVGDEVNLLLWVGGYSGWDYRENDPITGAYEITYTPTVPEILTETRTLETCVNGLLNPIGSLRNKVWYCAGDSTTHGMEGRSYAEIIAERNGMELWKDGIGGTVMTSYPDGSLYSAFSFDRYLNIPENVDFVTLWFGINDSRMGYPVGELDSDDPATFCGAYNKVLTWIINNRPNARVGLVVTHSAFDSFKNAIRNLAKKYGFFVFDLQTDPRIPFWHPTDSYYANDVDEAVKTLRKSQWWADPLHPLTAGYEAISYPFESWLRSL